MIFDLRFPNIRFYLIFREDLRKKLEAGKKQKPTKEAKASKKKALAAVEEEDSDEKEDDSDDELNEVRL